MSNRHNKEEEFIENMEEIRECRQFINNLYSSNSGENIKFTERIIYKLEPKTNKIEVQRHFLAEEAFNFESTGVVKSINQKINESKWATNELMRYFKPESVIQIGQKLDSINDLEKLSTIGKNHKINFEDGKIYLIYIWSFYKPICKKQLTWLSSLYQKKNWDNNASFLAINTDKNRQYALKLIKLLQVDQVFQNYYIDTGKFVSHPLIDVANKYGYPTTILVNNDGIVELCGSIFDINLEERIELLLKRQRQKNDVIPLGVIDEQGIKDLKYFCRSIFPKKVMEKINDINAYHLYGANIKIVYKFKANKKNNFRDENERKNIHRVIEAYLDYFSHTTDINIFDEIFKTLIDSKNNMKIIRNIVDTYEIPYIRTPFCSICKKTCVDAYCQYFIEENKTQNLYYNMTSSTDNNQNNQNTQNTQNTQISQILQNNVVKKKKNDEDISKISDSYDDVTEEEDNEKEFNTVYIINLKKNFFYYFISKFK